MIVEVVEEEYIPCEALKKKKESKFEISGMVMYKND